MPSRTKTLNTDAHIRALLRSPTYQRLGVDDRKEVLAIYREASPKLRGTILERLGGSVTTTDQFDAAAEDLLGPDSPMNLNAREVGRFSGALVTGLAGGAGGATLGAKLGTLATPLVGPMAIPIGAILGEVGGSLAARRLNVATGLEDEGQTIKLPGIGEQSLGDVLSVAAPGANQVVRGITTAVGRLSRAGKAVQAAEEKSADDLLRHQTQVDEATKKAQEATEIDLGRHQAQERAAVQKAQDQNLKATAKHQTKMDAFDTAAAAHADATTGFNKLIPKFRGIGPSSAKLYEEVAQANPEVPLVKAREAAESVLAEIDTHLPAFRNSRLAKVAKDLRDFGTEFDEAGNVIATREPTFQEFQKLQQDLGKALGDLSDRNDSARGLAKQLYRGTRADLIDAPNHTVGATRTQFLAANAAFRKEKAIDDLARVLERGVSIRPEDNTIIINSRSVRAGFKRLVEEDRLFAGSFSAKELQGLKEELMHLTSLPKVPSKPGPTPTPQKPDFSKIKPHGVEAPDLSKIKPPETFEPELPPVRIGRGLIHGHVAGSSIGGMLGHFKEGAIIGTIAGVAIPALSHLLAAGLLSPTGRPILRKMMSGDVGLTPKTLAGLTVALRKVGDLPDDDQ